MVLVKMLMEIALPKMEELLVTMTMICPSGREVPPAELRESWIRGSSDSRTISFGRTVGL